MTLSTTVAITCLVLFLVFGLIEIYKKRKPVITKALNTGGSRLTKIRVRNGKQEVYDSTLQDWILLEYLLDEGMTADELGFDPSDYSDSRIYENHESSNTFHDSFSSGGGDGGSDWGSSSSSSSYSSSSSDSSCD